MKREATGTEQLTQQAFEAIEELLRSFERRAETEPEVAAWLEERLSAGDLYDVLLAQVFDMMIALMAEERGMVAP